MRMVKQIRQALVTDSSTLIGIYPGKYTYQDNVTQENMAEVYGEL